MLTDAAAVPATAVEAPETPETTPSWLTRPSAMRHTEPEPLYGVSGVVREQYPYVFETMLDRVREGTPLRRALAEDPRRINVGDFMAWVMRSDERRSRYHEAQEVAAEIVAADLIPIADAVDSMEDVSRSALRVATRRDLLKVWSRKRYGDVKQLDVKQESNFTFTLTRPGDALPAPAVTRVIDGETGEVDDA